MATLVSGLRPCQGCCVVQYGDVARWAHDMNGHKRWCTCLLLVPRLSPRHAAAAQCARSCCHPFRAFTVIPATHRPTPTHLTPHLPQPTPHPPAAEPPFPDGTLRLVGGPDAATGQVQVSFNGLWGTVCDGECVWPLLPCLGGPCLQGWADNALACQTTIGYYREYHTRAESSLVATAVGPCAECSAGTPNASGIREAGMGVQHPTPPIQYHPSQSPNAAP